MEKDKKQILGKLKLNKLSENELEKREMRILKGGSDCPDGCSPNTSISNATKNNRNDLSANEQQDIYLFLRAHTRELESNRIFPKLKPSLTLENMGLSGGYAGEGMYRLTALGAIETSWQQLL